MEKPLYGGTAAMSGAEIEGDLEDDFGGTALSLRLPEEMAGERMDKALAALCPELSRVRVRALMESGAVREVASGRALDDPSARARGGEEIEVIVPDPVAAVPQPEAIPLSVQFEDAEMIVLDKPAGLVVHPGAGNPSGTLVNALLHHCRGSLSGIGGVLRPGIVHRLDKETSGLMLAAKTDRAHQALAAQLADRSLSREYLALVLGVPAPPTGLVDKPIGRHPSDRLRMAVVRRGGREARTRYRVIEAFGGEFALVACKLETGRTHQIRVHMASIGHPLIGDPFYGPQPTAVRGAVRRAGGEPDLAQALLDFPRQALHAARIAFLHPLDEEEKMFESALPDDFSALIEKLRLAFT